MQLNSNNGPSEEPPEERMEEGEEELDTLEDLEEDELEFSAVNKQLDQLLQTADVMDRKTDSTLDQVKELLEEIRQERLEREAANKEEESKI